MSEKRTTPILGFRAWKFDSEYNLCGLTKDWTWPLGHAEAKCLRFDFLDAPSGHDSPDEGCTCGFYGLNSLAAVDGDRWRNNSMSMLLAPPRLGAIEGASYVTGAIVGWGRMVMHEHGWKAQYAKPVVLCHDDRTPMAVQKVAEKYGLPLVHKNDLEQVAREFGEPYSPPADWKPSKKGADSGVAQTWCAISRGRGGLVQRLYTFWITPGTVITNQRLELCSDGTMTTTTEWSDGRVEKRVEPTSSLIAPRWGGFSW